MSIYYFVPSDTRRQSVCCWARALPPFPVRPWAQVTWYLGVHVYVYACACVCSFPACDSLKAGSLSLDSAAFSIRLGTQLVLNKC